MTFIHQFYFQCAGNCGYNEVGLFKYSFFLYFNGLGMYQKKNGLSNPECDLTEIGREMLREEEFPEVSVEFQVCSLLNIFEHHYCIHLDFFLIFLYT